MIYVEFEEGKDEDRHEFAFASSKWSLNTQEVKRLVRRALLLHRTRLDYYLPMLSPNDGYNEETHHAECWPSPRGMVTHHMSNLHQGSEFGHWKVTGEQDAFAFRHPASPNR